jgi:hypothetical protein
LRVHETGEVVHLKLEDSLTFPEVVNKTKMFRLLTNGSPFL